MSFAAWAPLAFELADALLLLAIFRLLTDNRRLPYLAVGSTWAWSPGSGRTISRPGVRLHAVAGDRIHHPALAAGAGLDRPGAGRSRIGRLRARLLSGMAPAPTTTQRQRYVALVLLVPIFFVIVAAHQLTPYVILAGVGALTVMDLLRPRWLLVILAAVATAYLIPRYGLISHDFGGLFSGGNPIQNASGSQGTHHAGGRGPDRPDRAPARRGDVATRARRDRAAAQGAGSRADPRLCWPSARSSSSAPRATAARRSIACICSRRLGARC